MLINKSLNDINQDAFAKLDEFSTLKKAKMVWLPSTDI